MTPARQAEIKKEGEALLYNFAALEKAIQGYQSTSATWIQIHNQLQAFSGDVYAWFVAQELWTEAETQAELTSLQTTLENIEIQIGSPNPLPLFDTLISQFVFFNKRALTKAHSLHHSAASESVTQKSFTVAKGLQVLKGYLNSVRSSPDSVSHAQNFLHAIEGKLFAISESLVPTDVPPAHLTAEVMDRWCSLYDAAAEDVFNAHQAYKQRSLSQGNKFFFELCDELLKELVLLSDTLNSRNLRVQQDSTREVVKYLEQICIAIQHTCIHFPPNEGSTNVLLAIANSFLVSSLELMSFSNFKTVGNPLVLLDISTLCSIRSIYTGLYLLFLAAPNTFTTTENPLKHVEYIDVCFYHGRPTVLQLVPQSLAAPNLVGRHDHETIRQNNPSNPANQANQYSSNQPQLLVENANTVDQLLADILTQETGYVAPTAPTLNLDDVDALLGEILQQPKPAVRREVAPSEIDDLLAEIDSLESAPKSAASSAIGIDVVDDLLSSIGIAPPSVEKKQELKQPDAEEVDNLLNLLSEELTTRPPQATGGRLSTKAEMMAFFAAETKKKEVIQRSAQGESQASNTTGNVSNVSNASNAGSAEKVAKVPNQSAKGDVTVKTKPVLAKDASEEEYKQYMIDKYEFEQWENAQTRAKLLAEGKL